MSVTDVREEALAVEPGASPASGAPIRQSNLWKDAWRRYIRNKAAVVAGAVFVVVLLYCLVAPIVSPYDPNEVDFADREARRRASSTRSGRTSSAATSSRGPLWAGASRS